jgi:4-hydroxy-2-oxoglutarate aldolase
MGTMKLAGVFAPVPTPFDEQHRLDTVRFRGALARWMATPLTGIVVLGSSGEAALVDEEESERTIAAAREGIASGRTLIAGTGRESTRATVHASRRAAELGADAVLVRTPSFFKQQMTPDALVSHYTAVADGSPVPVLLYSFAALTGVTLAPATVARRARHPNIIGMKESGGDVGHIGEIVSSVPPGFQLLAGSGSSFYPSLCVGVSGGILAVACVLPEACCRIFNLVRAGQHDQARALQQEILAVARLLGTRYGVPGLKAALRIIGCDVGVPRPPLPALEEKGVSTLKDALSRFIEAAA